MLGFVYAQNGGEKRIQCENGAKYTIFVYFTVEGLDPHFQGPDNRMHRVLGSSAHRGSTGVRQRAPSRRCVAPGPTVVRRVVATRGAHRGPPRLQWSGGWASRVLEELGAGGPGFLNGSGRPNPIFGGCWLVCGKLILGINLARLWGYKLGLVDSKEAFYHPYPSFTLL